MSTVENNLSKPPYRPKVTKPPTAKKAISLTTDSTATAVTMPSCRSVGSRRRTPKTMVKTHMSAMVTRPTLSWTNCSAGPVGSVMTWKVSLMALIWRAMYGVVPTKAERVIIAATTWDLPYRTEMKSAIEVMR